jgi:hypothetical protein
MAKKVFSDPALAKMGFRTCAQAVIVARHGLEFEIFMAIIPKKLK